MFANNDKFILSLVNIKDFKNTFLDCSYTLPTNIPDDILNNIASIDVFEYHEGKINNGFIAFSIYVGKKNTLNNLLTYQEKITTKNNIKIANVNDLVLYRIIDNQIIILNTLKPNDIVVQNKEELKQIINNLSLEFTNLKNTISRIRTLN